MIHIISNFVYKVRFHIYYLKCSCFICLIKYICAQVKQLKINAYSVPIWIWIWNWKEFPVKYCTELLFCLKLAEISCFLINCLYFFRAHILQWNLARAVSVSVMVTSVLEAKTDQVDNLVLSLVMYMLLLPVPWTAN